MTEQAKKYVYGELIETLKTDGVVPTRDIVRALVDLEVKLQVQQYYTQQLRDGLKFYSPGPFWTTVIVDTKAADDQGKHAEWVLRLTDPEAT